MAPEKRYGLSLPVHVTLLSVYVLLFVGFFALAVITATFMTYTWFQWVVVGFLVLSSGLSAAWELRVVLLMQKAKKDASRSS